MNELKTLQKLLLENDVSGVRDWVNRVNDLEITDEMGWTPVFYGVASGRHEATQVLLEAGANPLHLDVVEWDALMHAELNGDTKMVSLIRGEAVTQHEAGG
ncbi:MAG: ankyrin repeat domain-containing protein [Maricaulaceae bacterium]